MIKKLFLENLNRLLNAYLRLDPKSTERLQRLRGHTIAIELLPMHLFFIIQVVGDELVIKQETPIETSVKITGTPIQMLGVALNKKDRHRFFADDVKIEGSAMVAQQIIQLFDAISVDWEEQLSQFIGDSSAHHVGKFLGKAKLFLQDAKESFSENVTEYVHEEMEWLPKKEKCLQLFEEIDRSRMDTDRLATRIQLIKQKANEA